MAQALRGALELNLSNHLTYFYIVRGWIRRLVHSGPGQKINPRNFLSSKAFIEMVGLKA